MEWIDALINWFLGLGEEYGVNPFIFGGIYVGAIPFFTISAGWIVRNYKKQISIVVPVLSASFCFVSAYLYLIFAGENVPLWVYGIVVLMLVYGAWAAIKKVQAQLNEEEI